jgi:hypothetical protein
MPLTNNTINQDSSCDRLTQFAEEYRRRLVIENGYNDTTGNRYNAQHPNATQAVGGRDPQNVRGRGTGVFLDTTNGGTSVDINGLPEYPNSGRNGINFLNRYTAQTPYSCRLPQ